MAKITPEELAQKLGALFLKRARDPAGALFSMVLRNTQQGSFLISGKVMFWDEPLEARTAILNPQMTLVEEWIPGGSVAVQRLKEILAGQGSLGSIPISGTSSDAYIEPTGRWFKSTSVWREWRIRSRLARVEFVGEDALPSEPIIARGMRPFLSGAHALREWLFDDRDAWKGESSQFLWELITILPDARIRIRNAEWRDAFLEIELEVNVPEQSYEVQVLYVGSRTRRYDIVRAAPMLRLEIPEEVESAKIFVVDESGDVLAERSVHRSEAKLATSAVSVSEEERILMELKSGENELVEYKPFVDAKDQQKEAELVKTIVAFSNSKGGRLYVGVDDNGNPQGLSELKKATKRADDGVDIQLKSVTDRLEQLFRANVKPFPSYRLKVHDKDGRPVIVVDVKAGDQPPYASAQNEYFVRHGSSSMRPDPSELRRLLHIGSGNAGTFLAPGNTIIDNVE
ncbi:ATP-binding protein [Myxococcus sp. K15C18031901]|uniref:AlbA family DNA-binding domain-containing protein n=1 Tax=Myxococcus dinghuensis TaxID=2906761 RepID=UPI0020A70BE2|nr:ATP-binding protein [Myxococcus dinghuensis]MCP3104550.1 ATP-binding protein [Myxococcus dinghuensis]